MKLAYLFVSMSLVGCALTEKADVLDTRYFSPAMPVPSSRPSAAPAGSALELQLGRVSASAYLKTRIVFRTSDVEVGTYQDRKWTERPEEYVRRALIHALFEERGLTRSLTGDAPMLDIEVAAFEEIRGKNGPGGRVAIRYSLYDDRRVLATDMVSVDRRASSDSPEAIAAAIGAALDQAVEEAAAEVVSHLGPRPAAE